MELLTTAIGKKMLKKPTVLLGEWCINSTQINEQEFSHTVCKYHWEDRSKFLKDYEYIRETYYNFLDLLSRKLNELHNLDNSNRQWEIIIGPWLRTFISTLFDKYSSLKIAKDHYGAKTILYFDTPKHGSPKNVKEFFKHVMTDSWSQEIYYEINQSIKLLETNNAVIPGVSDIVKTKECFSYKNYIKNILGKLNALLLRNNNTVFTQLDLGYKELVEISFKLSIFPTIFLPNRYKSMSENIRSREIINLGDFENEFEDICSKLIPKYIPRSYVEDFDAINKLIREWYPKSPKKLVTTVGYYLDDVHKIWISRLISNGTKYVINQHGGHFGTSLINDSEELQLDTADYFTTWGWERSSFNGSAKIVPLPSLKLSKIKKRNKKYINRKRNGDNIIFPLSEWPKHAYRLYAAPVSSLQLKYFEEVFDFSGNLDSRLKKKLRFRNAPVSRGWDSKKRFFNKNLVNQYGTKNKTFVDDLFESSVAVINTNSTTILESFSLNIPTLIILDYDVWLPNEMAISDFNLLKDSQILFESSKDAAFWLNENFDSLEEWWMEKERQELLNEFIKKYAYSSEDYLNQWKRFINTI
ncbi:LIC12162 family protein [Gammaproteobacteria bacterium]|nr:LIC12162 family protein [Gammaproteobacteria bacterium]